MVYKKFISKKKTFAILIDPDKYNQETLKKTINNANNAGVDFIFVGGSLLTVCINESINIIKENTSMPIVLFPGSIMQISLNADAILLLSLISGRNPDFLIGNHVVAANILKRSKLEIIPTGYMIIENHKTTSVEYMSNTKPIPNDKPDIAVSTAIAGEMLGNKLIFLEGGSGALTHVNSNMIKAVKENISIPLIVGGGIKNEKDITDVCKAGADIIVIGNAIEIDKTLIKKAANIIHSF